MLGDSHPSSRDNKSCDRRNVERPGSIATRAAGINQSLAPSATGIEHSRIAHRNRSCGGTNRLSEANDLFDGFALHGQPDEQCRDLRIGAFAGKHLVHYRTGFFARERLAMSDDSMQGLNQHARAEDCTGSEGRLVATRSTGGTFLPRKKAPLHLAESEMEWA